MVVPWGAYGGDPHLTAYFFAAAAASYSQMQQSEFWQQQAKSSLINPSLMQQSNQQKTPPNLSAISNLLPSHTTIPSLLPNPFVTSPLLPNPLVNSPPSNSSLSINNNNAIKGEQNNSSPTLTTSGTINNIPPYLPAEFSYNFNSLMLRTLGLNAASIQQQQQQQNPSSTVNQFDQGFLNHLRELSDAQSNESSNFKLTNDHSHIKPSSLDFRSSSSASDSSACSTPTTPTPLQISTNNNYLANSSASSLATHSTANCKSNLSLKNLNQINDCDSSSLSSSPIHLQSNGSISNSILNKQIKNETTKIDLNAIEQFNTTLNVHNSKTNDLISSNCGNLVNNNKPLFQPYLSKLS